MGPFMNILLRLCSWKAPREPNFSPWTAAGEQAACKGLKMETISVEKGRLESKFPFAHLHVRSVSPLPQIPSGRGPNMRKGAGGASLAFQREVWLNYYSMVCMGLPLQKVCIGIVIHSTWKLMHDHLRGKKCLLTNTLSNFQDPLPLLDQVTNKK